MTSRSRHILMRSLATMLLCGLVVALAGASYPLLRNFPRQLYEAGTKNWAVSQTPDGCMLFGNELGLLEFNSVDWTLYRVKNRTAVRSILTDSVSARIYVGVSGDFGYFEPAPPTGGLQYRSLFEDVSLNIDVHEVWNILRVNNDIYFQDDFNIFLYHEDKPIRVISIGSKITASVAVNNAIFIGLDNGGLLRLDTRDLSVSRCAVTPTGTRICALVPLTVAELLVVTPFDGIYSYSEQRLTPFDIDINTFIKENQAFCAAISGDKLAIGTVNRGAVLKNLTTGEVNYINVATGMQNNTVLNMGFDRFENLWLTLDNGIDYAVTNSPVSNLLGVVGHYGSGYASLNVGDKLYLGTNQGLFAMPFPAKASPTPPTIAPVLQGQVWSIDTIAGAMFVSSDVGLFVRNGDRFAQIGGVPGTVSVVPLAQHAGKALASTYDGFYLLEQRPTGWAMKCRVEGFSESRGRPVQDAKGFLWIDHWLKGVYRLKLSADGSRFDSIRLYNAGYGLPSDDNNVAQMLDNQLVFSTTSGVYMHKASVDSMAPLSGVNPIFSKVPSARFINSPSGNIWIVGPNRVLVTSQSPAGDFTVDSVTYRPLEARMMVGRENFNFISNRQLIVGNEDGFYDVAIGAHNPELLTRSCPVHISAIYANQDSLIYDNSLFNTQARKIEIPYDLNSIRIDFIAPEYRAPNAVRYSVRLNGDNWSQYANISSKEYTNLPAGNYTFEVRAINDYTGVESQTLIRFRILSPWYLSAWAIFIYIIVTLLVMYGIVGYFKAYSKRAALDVERKKDYEIAQLKSQQLEHDIKSKSGELSNTTMNLIRKNEILLDISEKLSKLADTLPADTDTTRLRRHVARIKEDIRENISHDDDLASFTSNFDVVYENYMKRLLAKYPNLTPTDQRLCAYLKMGLSSKDIAPLMSISFRSVEMSRYRLRKKLGLSRDTNLADYLRNF